MKYALPFLCFFVFGAYAQKSEDLPEVHKSTDLSGNAITRDIENTTVFTFCDSDGDGFTTIDVENVKNVIISKHPGLSNQTETIFLSEDNGTIIKVENPSTMPAVSLLCPASGENTLDVAVNSYGQIFTTGVFQTRKKNNCATVATYDFGGNALSFDPNNNLYLPWGDSKVMRSVGTDYNNYTVWHDFADSGMPAGDFVYLNGKIYVAWLLYAMSGVSYRLYEVTVDANYNYISHIDRGELPYDTFGLASEFGKLYGSTIHTLYRINLTDFTFDTLYAEPNPTDQNGWSGASSLHESGYGANAFLTQADAANYTNPLPNSWINTIAGGQTIYVSIYNSVDDTYNIFPVQISVIAPNAMQPETFFSCSTAIDGVGLFDLGQQDDTILGPLSAAQYGVSYHLSQSDADIGINPLSIPYQNISNPQVIYARLASLTDPTCFDTTTFQIEVRPKVILDVPETLTICDNQAGVLSAPDGFAGYHWSTGDNSQSINVSAAGNYELTVTDDLGCNASKTITVTMTICGIPKGISANGDGANDNFDLTAFDVRHLKIFNRYGMGVFEKENYTDQWHGQNQGGGALPSGTYYYLVKLRSGELKSGWVYLIREQ